MERVPVSEHTDETPVQSHEFNEHSPPAVAANIEPARELIRVETKLQAITWDRRERQRLLRPGVSTEATHESEGGQSLVDHAIRPAVTEPGIALKFPKVTTPAQSQSPGTVPIHVRVGRVEVRGTPQQEPARSIPKEGTPLGFASYHRMRRYRT